MTASRFLDRSFLWYVGKRKCALHNIESRLFLARILRKHRVVGNGYETFYRTRFAEDMPSHLYQVLKSAELKNQG